LNEERNNNLDSDGGRHENDVYYIGGSKKSAVNKLLPTLGEVPFDIQQNWNDHYGNNNGRTYEPPSAYVNNNFAEYVNNANYGIDNSDGSSSTNFLNVYNNQATDHYVRNGHSIAEEFEDIVIDYRGTDIKIKTSRRNLDLIMSIVHTIHAYTLVPPDVVEDTIRSIVFNIERHNLDLEATKQYINVPRIPSKIKEAIIKAYDEHRKNHLNLVKQTDCLEILFNKCKDEKVIKDDEF